MRFLIQPSYKLDSLFIIECTHCEAFVYLFCISVLYICFSCTGLHVLFILVNVDVHGTVKYIIKYVVTFAQIVNTKAALRKGGSMEPIEPPLDPPLL